MAHNSDGLPVMVLAYSIHFLSNPLLNGTHGLTSGWSRGAAKSVEALPFGITFQFLKAQSFPIAEPAPPTRITYHGSPLALPRQYRGGLERPFEGTRVNRL